MPLLLKIFYRLKSLIPRFLQLLLRRMLVARQLKRHSDVWPIDPAAGQPPSGWKGWPDGKRFALVLTHDVETKRGHDRCRLLLEREARLEFRSAFNFVPKRYDVSPALRHFIASSGFEVGVHGLYHDGKYFESRGEFLRRAQEINRYLKEWEAVGYRTPSMHHKLDWILDLDILYDESMFDTDPFEPYADGVGTIFPFWFGGGDGRKRGYVELPYTLPQDFTPFILMRESNNEIWKKKLDWIAEKGGMALLNTHPDYMCFDGGRLRSEEYPVSNYIGLLEYIKSRYSGQYWHVLPREMADFWIRAMVKEA